MNLRLRSRIALWFVAGLALIVAALAGFLIVELRRDLGTAIDNALTPAAEQIRHDVNVDGTKDFHDSAQTVLKGERAAAQLLTPDGSIRSRFGDGISAAAMASPADVAAALAGRRRVASRTLGAGHDDFRVVSLGVVSPQGRRYVIVAAQSTEPVDRSVGRLVRLLLIGGPVALLLAAGTGWWLARRALRPVEQITRAAEVIGVARLAERVPTGPANDEIAHLARTINTMLDRIGRGVLEQQRLVADTSHELRTPLAAMRSELDVSLRADDLPSSAREVLLSARDEVDALGRTVDDLLTLATGDGDAQGTATPTPVDLAALARTAVLPLTPAAHSREVTVVHRGPPVTVLADPGRLTQAIRNLVENAIAFSPRGGTVQITTAADATIGQLTVSDDGPGVPVELRERIFDRFFRADPSRSRATGGSGLGLAITRQIVEAYGGTVHAESGAGGSGSAFVLTLARRAPGPGSPPGVGEIA